MSTFSKLVSNLSFSPSANSQLTYYWRRLGKEQLTRKLSLVMAGGLVVLQLATVIAPADAANAGSTNNIISNGIDTSHPQKTLLNIYDSNSEIRALFNHYGVYKVDIEKTTHGTLNSSNHNFKSLGRNTHSVLDQKVTIGSHTYYIRPLYTWGDGITYKVLEGRRHSDNKYFAIMYDCGNLVVTDTTPEKPAKPVTPAPNPTPPPPPPPAKPKTAPTPTPTPTTQPTPTPTPTPPPVVPVVVPENPSLSQSKTGIIQHSSGSTEDANGGTAQAGDIIEYTLVTKNSGLGGSNNYVVTENLNDDLEYASLLDGRGGVLKDGELSWGKVNIKALSSYTVTYQLKVKNPIPVTPRSSSDPESFDLKMDNIYGNLVSTNLVVPAAKQVEVATEALPQTGPGLGSVVVMLLFGLIVYFYLRNRQLLMEVSILRGDHHGSGGDNV